MIKSTTLVPAYGRDYKTAKAVKADWADDKDFIIADYFDPYDTKPVNRSDAIRDGMKRVGIRYARLTKQVFINVKPSEPSRVHFPSIKDVAAELRLINANADVDGGGRCDVRLQVRVDSSWTVRYGLSDYDQDHNGYWGGSSVPGVQGGVVKRFNSHAVARDLLNQMRDHYTLQPLEKARRV